MSNQNVVAPSLPVAPVEYEKRYMDQFLQVLRLYFTQLDNNGPFQATTLNLSSIDQTTKLQVVSIPTQASVASLRVGDVYYDTTAGNVLKIKT